MRLYWYCSRPLAVETDLTDRLIAGQDVRYAVKPLKTGLPFVDKMAIMEIIWYAAQFKAIGQGKKPNPKLSPLIVFLNYAKGNIKAVVQGRVNSRKVSVKFLKVKVLFLRMK